MTELVRCIYCKEDAPSSAEHILLAGLGGELTIPCVCQRCNHDFGNTIDRGLLRESPFVIDRLFDPAADSGKVTFFHDAKLGGHFDLIGDALLPQVFFTESGEWSIIGVAETAPAALRKALCSLPERLPRIVSERRENHPTRLVVQKRRLVLRARREEDAHSFERRLRSSVDVILGLGERMGCATPVITSRESHVLLTMSCDANWPSRCAAKMLFNLAAHHLGPQFVLRSEFDPVRDFIAGRNVEPVETVVGPHGERGWTMDVRYVRNWLKSDPRDGTWPLRTREHGLLLDGHNGVLGGVAFLWGRPTFKLALARFDHAVRVGKALPVLLLKEGGQEEIIEGMLDICLRFGVIEPAVPSGLSV